MLTFDIKRSGFPIKVGEVEFFFDTSVEKLREFWARQEEYQAKRTQIEKEAAELVSSADIDEENPEYVHKLYQSLDKTMGFTKKLIKNDYDALLGEGSFDKLYAVYPDVDQLQAIFDDIAEAVADAIETDAKKRSDEMQAKKAELLKKKAIKHKK